MSCSLTLGRTDGVTNDAQTRKHNAASTAGLTVTKAYKLGTFYNRQTLEKLKQIDNRCVITFPITIKNHRK